MVELVTGTIMAIYDGIHMIKAAFEDADVNKGLSKEMIKRLDYIASLIESLKGHKLNDYQPIQELQETLREANKKMNEIRNRSGLSRLLH